MTLSLKYGILKTWRERFSLRENTLYIWIQHIQGGDQLSLRVSSHYASLAWNYWNKCLILYIQISHLMSFLNVSFEFLSPRAWYNGMVLTTNIAVMLLTWQYYVHFGTVFILSLLFNLIGEHYGAIFLIFIVEGSPRLCLTVTFAIWG